MTMEYITEQIQGGLDKLPKEQKMSLLESLRKERNWFRDNKEWTKITKPELRRLNLVEKQIELLEVELNN
ncbi:MAG: hypothetical protein AABY22_32090 [Nanoarchaeota archaeon]